VEPDAGRGRSGARADRAAAAAARIDAGFARHAQALGIDRRGRRVGYRPRSHAGDAAALARELAERLDADLARGYTTHGPTATTS
jgi:recombinational DNA repair ATPase RecF